MYEDEEEIKFKREKKNAHHVGHEGRREHSKPGRKRGIPKHRKLFFKGVKKKRHLLVGITDGSGYLIYARYIKSKLWFDRRALFIKKFGAWCRACKSRKFIVVHHLDYRRMGYERDSDLAVLCKPCHKELHADYGHGHENYKKFLSDVLSEKKIQ